MGTLVVGCGSLGCEFARRAVASGHEVLGLRRSDRPLPQGVTALRGDVTMPNTLRLPASLDALVYAVAASGRTDEAYEAAYPSGLRNVLRALPSAPSRVVFVSSTAVYGQVDGSVVDEESATEPSAFNGSRMLEAEQVLADHWEGTSIRATSLRLGGIYGPGRTYLLDSVREGRARYLPNATEWSNRIHATDAARAIEHVLELVAPPPVLNVVDPHPAPRREVLEWLAGELGAPQPQPGDGAGRRRGGDKRVDSSRLVRTGFRFEYPVLPRRVPRASDAVGPWNFSTSPIPCVRGATDSPTSSPA